MQIRIKVDKIGEAEAVLDISRNPMTVHEIIKRLPIEAKALRWGDETLTCQKKIHR